MKRASASFLVGVIFACGLGLSGMTNPNKVLAFLDVTGAWDPSLIFVMLGAIAVNMLLSRLILKRAAPLLDTSWHLPKKHELDRPLLAGASLFGIGWGLAGFCPGPAFTTLGYGKVEISIFVGAMIFGGIVHHFWQRRSAQSS